MKFIATLLAAGLCASLQTLPSAAEAAPCTTEDAGLIANLAETGAAVIVRRNGGGQQVRHRMVGCTRPPGTDLMRLEMRIDWRGALNASNRYHVNGFLEFDLGSRTMEFDERSASRSLRDYRQTMLWVGGGVLALGALGALDEAAPTTGREAARIDESGASTSSIAVINTCGVAARFSLRWRDVEQGWRAGDWTIRIGQTAVLTTRNVRLRTDSRAYLLHVRDAAGRTLVSGTHAREVNGVRRMMVQRVAPRLPMTIRLCD